MDTPEFSHAFLIDYLYPLEVRVRPMFGNTSLYIGEKSYFATRHRADKTADNGIWIGTQLEHHESLKAQFPSLTNLNSFRIRKWLLLPETAEDFEETARQFCLLVIAEDERLGVTPKPKKKRKG